MVRRRRSLVAVVRARPPTTTTRGRRFVRTTAFAKELDDAIESLRHWPDVVRRARACARARRSSALLAVPFAAQRAFGQVRRLQRDWLGRRDGALVQFRVALHDGREERLSVFTTRPETVRGVTFVALSAAHPLVRRQQTLLSTR